LQTFEDHHALMQQHQDAVVAYERSCFARQASYARK
jgi:hypothetical protein